MLKWPSKARGAIRKLFEPLQEIDVYVEDENDEAFYRCLLNSATSREVKIARVFSLGGRNAYSGERDRSFRPIVTAAHEMVLRG